MKLTGGLQLLKRYPVCMMMLDLKQQEMVDSQSKTAENEQEKGSDSESDPISATENSWLENYCGTPKGNRTPDSAVRGLRLNRLTMRANLQTFCLRVTV